MGIKKYMLTGIICLLLGFAYITPAMAAANINIGYNQNYNAFTFSIGQEVPQNSIFEIGFLIGWNYTDALDYPCPHWDYYIEDSHSFAYGIGMDKRFSLHTTDNFSFYVGLGLYFNIYNTIARSNATGWLYIQDSSYEFEPAFSCGAKVGNFGVGYHNIRGYNIDFTINF